MQALEGGGTGSGTLPGNGLCFRCGQQGHRAAECQEPLQPGQEAGRCDFCEQYGHRQKQCPLWQKYKALALKQVQRQKSTAAAASTQMVTALTEEDVAELFDQGVIACDALSEEEEVYEHFMR